VSCLLKLPLHPWCPVLQNRAQGSLTISLDLKPGPARNPTPWIQLLTPAPLVSFTQKAVFVCQEMGCPLPAHFLYMRDKWALRAARRGQRDQESENTSSFRPSIHKHQVQLLVPLTGALRLSSEDAVAGASDLPMPGGLHTCDSR
jgi:hypothetical protein